MKKLSLMICFFCSFYGVNAQSSYFEKDVDKVMEKVINWRHDIHQNPELGNREFETGKKIAAHLESLGIQVDSQVAHTGVVGVLQGGKPGPVIALRADMDALPIVESVDLPWVSKAKTIYNGNEVGVMHACGHDTHVAILMGVAEVLAKHKKEIHGTVKFLFQPAEEGAPQGEEGGAELMVKEGVLKNPDVDVAFGLHISSALEVGKITYKPEGTMASSNTFKIVVKGKGSHGAYPWASVDPIVVSAQIINSLQTIVSRNIDVTENAAVVTIGSIHGGNRSNIIAPSTELVGTIRALSVSDRDLIFERVQTIASNTAEAMGAKAEVVIESGYPVTYNDPKLTVLMAPSLEKAVGAGNAYVVSARTGAEDFSFFAQEVPGLYFSLGGMPKGTDPSMAPPHHTSEFYVDDSGMVYGVQAFLNLVMNYPKLADQ
ncbi:MAG: amidohydrolase [Flavobacteriaceae bacterium]